MKLHQHITTLLADLETPVGLYLKIRDLYPCSALLESSDYHTNQNSVSIIGVDPIGSFTVINDTVIMRYPDGEEIVTAADNVPESLKGYINSFSTDIDDQNLFTGLLGYTA